MSLKGNKGEWSELYAFFKILDQKTLYGADADLNVLPDVFYPVLRVVRTEKGVNKTYEFTGGGITVRVDGAQPVEVEIGSLRNGVVQIFDAIKNGEKTFSIPSADDLIARFGVEALNAGNARKEDLTLKIHDKNTGQEPEVGYSIKSMIGHSATLLNASSATNFLYSVERLSDEDIAVINAIDTRSAVRDRINEILKRGGMIKFAKLPSEAFRKNLNKVDTVFMHALSNMLLAYYMGRARTISGLVEYVTQNHPTILEFDTAFDYEHKMKTFLQYVALGMVPGTLWDGELRAHGGFIIVKNDGELASYQAYDVDKFRSYLYVRTKLETPSTTRHEFGSLFRGEDNKLYISLNLQIRFI